MNNTISVITPAFNAEATIERAVRSVLCQTLNHWEMLIISDDGIDYRALLAARGIQDPRLRFFRSAGTASGPNATRNIGLQHATGDIIAPLDADDFYYPERFERLLPRLRAMAMFATISTIATSIALCSGNRVMAFYRLRILSRCRHRCY